MSLRQKHAPGVPGRLTTGCGGIRVQPAPEVGLVKRLRRGAVRDTYNLLADGIVKLMRALAQVEMPGDGGRGHRSRARKLSVQLSLSAPWSGEDLCQRHRCQRPSGGIADTRCPTYQTLPGDKSRPRPGCRDTSFLIDLQGHPHHSASGIVRRRRVLIHPQEAARALQQSAGYDEYERDAWWSSTDWPDWSSWAFASRYFGRAKTRFQLYLAATVANLTLVAGKIELSDSVGGGLPRHRVLVLQSHFRPGDGCSGNEEVGPGSNEAVGFPSLVADSICSSSPISSKMESKTPVATQRRNRRYTVSHLPNTSGKSRQGAPVLQIQIIPSNDMRLSLPFLPGSPGPPGKIGSMRFHCRSLKVRITSKQGHSPHHVAMK